MSFWNFRNDESNQENGVLQIDGVLQVEPDWWSMGGTVVARNIRRHLDRVKDVTVYINSPGGDVMAGAEIYTALREHSAQGKGRVTVKVSGIAASAASIVAMAGDEILMSPVAYMMIHNPWTGVQGNAKELRHQADVLDVIGEGLLNAYQKRTGKTRDELLAMLEAETYMSAQTCIDQGFADGILWEAPQQPADPKAKQPAAMMQAKNHNRQAVMAMLAAHGAADAQKDPQTSAQDAADAAKRADIAKRAAFVAGLFN